MTTAADLSSFEFWALLASRQLERSGEYPTGPNIKGILCDLCGSEQWRSRVSQNLNRLEDKGLLNSACDLTNSDTRVYRLTDTGEDVVRRRLQVQTRMFGSVTELVAYDGSLPSPDGEIEPVFEEPRLVEADGGPQVQEGDR